MDIPNNHELPRRLATQTNNQETLRRLYRRPQNGGFFQRASLAIDGFFSTLFQAVKQILIAIIVFLLVYAGFRFFLLILIGMQDTR